MGIFSSFNWFKSEKKKELEELKVSNQKRLGQLLEKKLEKFEAKSIEKPYKKIKLVGDVLTVVLNDGGILTKPNATQEDFLEVRGANYEYELLRIVSGKDVEEKKKEQEKEFKALLLASGVGELNNHPDFEVKDGSVYMKGVQRSLPELLVEKLATIIKDGKTVNTDEYQSLKKFWLKCCLNPNAQSAEDLYGFLMNHNFKIDKHGNFYAYRRVVSLAGDKKFIDFISNTYNKVKAVWKKKPSDYYVWTDDDATLSFSKEGRTDGINSLKGNLEDLYKKLPSLEENRYTSKHTGEEDYRVGEVVSMPRDKGNDDNSISCSYGFHAASKKYDYSGYGDTPILMIVNPIDVLAVPKGEVGKLRTCRWFFAMTLPETEKYILDEEDFDVKDLGDVFEEKCSENLQIYVQNSFAEEVKRHTFTLPNITGKEINKIVLSLEQMRDIVSKRVINAEEEE